MIKTQKISNIQLGLLIIGFITGDFILLMPPKSLAQDAWIAVLFAMIGGLLLISLYVYLSHLHQYKTLVEILYFCFGKIIGNLLMILYIIYFLSLSAIILRNITDYMIVVNYTKTPLWFVLMLIIIVIYYDVRKGIEVMGRLAEIAIPPLIMFILLATLLLVPKFTYDNIFPVMNDGIKPILKDSFNTLTFPFGEPIVFMMIFPFINKKEKIFKTSFISISIAGFILLLVTIRNILVLGPNLLTRSTYPTHTVATMISGLMLEPIIAINLLISGGVMVIVLFFVSILAISQIFKLDDYKTIAMPVSLFLIPFSIWIYDSLAQMDYINSEVIPYYALFFQIIIPFFMLIISLIKIKLKKNLS